MKFLLCIAALVAVAAAKPGVLGYNTYGHSYGYATPYGHYAHAPVVKAIAPVATSYANVHSVHQRPLAAAYSYGAYPYGHAYGYKNAAYGAAYPSVYAHGAYPSVYAHRAYPSVYGASSYGYKAYHY